MDAKRRATIIKKLCAGKGLTKPTFDPNYTRENRAWFVNAVVDAILGATPTPSDDTVEGLAREVINDANWAVALERDFSTKVEVQLDDKFRKIERKDVVRRVEIMYGVIAQNWALANTSKDNGFLDLARPTRMRRFISQRRYRAIVRMIYQVNPNANGFMWYPDECEVGPLHLQVNKEAQPFWQKLELTDDPPLKVKGQNKPDQAIAKVWERPHPNKPDKQVPPPSPLPDDHVCNAIVHHLLRPTRPKIFDIGMALSTTIVPRMVQCHRPNVCMSKLPGAFSQSSAQH